jgi:Na+/proline symporter
VSERVYKSPYGDSLKNINNQFEILGKKQKLLARQFVRINNGHSDKNSVNVFKDSLKQVNAQVDILRKQYKNVLGKADPAVDTNDTNYIFLRFVVDNLPVGLVGLLIAIIFLASWGSIAAALNALASCTMIDFYIRFKKHMVHPDQDIEDLKKYRQSKWFTLAWGIFCIIVAQFSNRMGSLIEAVNVLGSLFYGVILGIFLVAFYMKRITSDAVFWGAVIAEIIVVVLFILDYNGIIGLGFLWLNVVGALTVVILGYIFQWANRQWQRHL